MYAIIDFETTGGKFNEEGITEVAIYKYDGHQIVDQLITLVSKSQNLRSCNFCSCSGRVYQCELMVKYSIYPSS